MKLRRFLLTGIGIVLFGGLAAAAYLVRDHLPAWSTTVARPHDNHDDHDHGPIRTVKLTPQARANLHLTSRPVTLQTYWRTMPVPGMLIDRPGVSDRGITAPVAAVVSRLQAFPGDVVRPGDVLCTLRLVSEHVQNLQSELYRTSEEIKLTQGQIARAADAARSGALPEARLTELRNQERRLTTQVRATRQDLLTRGLTPGQVNEAATGQFVKEVTVVTPEPAADSPHLLGDLAAADAEAGRARFAFEVKELKVQLGEQVQAGQSLGLLANHRVLSIEGRAFKKEAPLLERAAQRGWPVDVTFAEDDSAGWPPLTGPFTIHHLGNSIDPTSRTFAVYLPLVNQSRTYQKDGRTFLVWRFRPGQRVRLHVQIDEFKDVIVLPADAVVRDGPAAYVFRRNGDAFDRKPVHVLFEERRTVVVANDGSVPPGVHVAQTGAAALNRVLAAQRSAGDGGHDHHGHSH
ncbi:MAG: efflux RND transporter periplasmic adaptor subunit [Gemmataceae bacterium]